MPFGTLFPSGFLRLFYLERRRLFAVLHIRAPRRGIEQSAVFGALVAALSTGATLRQAEDGQTLVLTTTSGDKNIMLTPVQTQDGVILCQQGVRCCGSSGYITAFSRDCPSKNSGLPGMLIAPSCSILGARSERNPEIPTGSMIVGAHAARRLEKAEQRAEKAAFFARIYSDNVAEHGAV